MQDRIRQLPHGTIDKRRWNEALARFPNALVYAESEFLDAMCPGWEALVLGDYEALFPLTRRRKRFISYLYQPFLAAQLGLFAPEVTAPLLQAFLNAIPARFRYIDISLNAACGFTVDGFPSYPRANFVLPLNDSYAGLEAAYRENIRRNVRKALQLGCHPDLEVPLPDIIALARAHTADEAGLESFRILAESWRSAGKAMPWGIRGKDGALLASAVFLRDARRAYYLLVGNHPNGRTIGASHLLIDTFIREHAGQNLLLDFEGSDIRNLAFFYQSFGARPEPYTGLRVNRLPWFARWLKRR